jgi:hypothetical protein
VRVLIDRENATCNTKPNLELKPKLKKKNCVLYVQLQDVIKAVVHNYKRFSTVKFKPANYLKNFKNEEKLICYLKHVAWLRLVLAAGCPAPLFIVTNTQPGNKPF